MSGGRVRVREEDGAPVVALDGEVDQAVLPGIEEAVRRATTGTCRWTLDLARVTYLDSAGLRLLLDLQIAAREADQRLHVVPPKPGMALRALRVSGVDRRLGIPPDDEADG